MNKYTLNQKAAKIFLQLIDGLTEGEPARKIGTPGGAFMPLCIEFLWEKRGSGWKIFSLTHYGEQNGDLMKDPDVTFFVKTRGKFGDVPSVETYCNDSHQNTPSFTIYATAWLMCDETNPPTSVCTDSDDYGSYDCHDFYDDVVNLTPALILN